MAYHNQWWELQCTTCCSSSRNSSTTIIISSVLSLTVNCKHLNWGRIVATGTPKNSSTPRQCDSRELLEAPWSCWCWCGKIGGELFICWGRLRLVARPQKVRNNSTVLRTAAGGRPISQDKAAGSPPADSIRVRHALLFNLYGLKVVYNMYL
jgi:hypothetical protein